jgi:hypothetical protein
LIRWRVLADSAYPRHLPKRYGAVAKVLAAAQHNRLRKLGFVNTSEFAH